MEYSAFLQLDDVRGESRTAPYLGWIPLLSASSPIVRESSSRDVVVVAPHGIHTPSLFKSVADGKEFRKGEVVFVRNGSKYLSWKMEGVLITGFLFSGASDGVPVESITLSPTSLSVSPG